MSDRIKQVIERLKGHGSALVCTLEPKHCREMASELEKGLLEGPKSVSVRDLERELAECRAAKEDAEEDRNTLLTELRPILLSCDSNTVIKLNALIAKVNS